MSDVSTDIILECQQFSDLGGWKIDSQFHQEKVMTYLLAHGLGVPVADARTTFNVATAGRYTLWARTKNWVYQWCRTGGAGKFTVIVNGEQCGGTLGQWGIGVWAWQEVGTVDLRAGENTVALHDLDGFDGRCDALFFSTDKDVRLHRAPVPAPRKVIADLVVVGGGIGGICAAISAARKGLKVALVQDRPVLGGANSSEVRVHLGGYQNLGEYPRLGDIVSEIGPAREGNAQPADYYEDERKLAAVLAEPNIELFLNTVVKDAEAYVGYVDCLHAINTITYEPLDFRAPLFVDATGDGTVGALAGADWRLGRESKSETGEEMAVSNADKMTMGASVQWYSEKSPEPTSFPMEPWMIRFNEDNCEYTLKGDWDWETGMEHDQLHDFETVRDYGMLVVYSNWAYLKNKSERRAEYANQTLSWVAYVAGKRETRRLLGDHILTQQDVFEEKPYPDGTCCTTWAIDLHTPMPSNAKNYHGEPFRSVCTHNTHYPYPIPYRCFYSRNIKNLFMVGRDISVTHVALGTTRVMRTHGMMGEVVGMAAAICKAHKCSPREVYEKYFPELQDAMKKGVGNGKPQPPQNYNQGTMKTR